MVALDMMAPSFVQVRSGEGKAGVDRLSPHPIAMRVVSIALMQKLS